MKILFIHALADPALGGGAEEIVWSQMRGLRDAGHECVLLATSSDGGLRHYEQEGITVWLAGIRNLYWPYHKGRSPHAGLRLLWHTQDSYNPWMQAYLKKLVALEKPDVASLHNLPGWSVASWKTLAHLGVPIVQILHDYYLICAKSTMIRDNRNCVKQCGSCRALRLPHRHLSRLVTGVVGVSNFMLERHQQLGYFKGVYIQEAIHNARDAVQLGLDSAAIMQPHEGLRIGYIGRLDRTKGIESLIAAFLQADISGSELWIAGSGKQDYERHLRDLTSDSRIRLLGRQRPSDFYPQVDVVAVPSLWNDNLPTVVFEAFAFGKPVIGAQRGGIPEMIRDGENGWLIEPTDIATFSTLLRSLDLRRDKLAAASEAAHTSSAPYINVHAWVERYENLYSEALLAHRRAQVSTR